MNVESLALNVLAVYRDIDIPGGICWAQTALPIIKQVTARSDRIGCEWAKPFILPLWRAFTRAKQAAQGIDFNDMLTLAIQLLDSDSDLLAHYRRRFRYIHIDEYQDTNQPQYRLFRLLAENRNNVFVVGDDDQAIYRFRGANVSNILNFKQDFPQAKTIKLLINYRSTPNIIRAANHVFRKKPVYLRKQLKSNRQSRESRHLENARIRFIRSPTEAEEVDKVVLEIERLKRKHQFSNGDICILCRLNDQVMRWQNEINLPGVNVQTIHGAKGLQYPVVFYIGLCEGLSPSLPRDKVSRRERAEMLAEEKRLFYVGITRARFRLYLCTAAKRGWYGKNRKFKPSRFLKLIPANVSQRPTLGERLKTLLLKPRKNLSSIECFFL